MASDSFFVLKRSPLSPLLLPTLRDIRDVPEALHSLVDASCCFLPICVSRGSVRVCLAWQQALSLVRSNKPTAGLYEGCPLAHFVEGTKGEKKKVFAFYALLLMLAVGLRGIDSCLRSPHRHSVALLSRQRQKRSPCHVASLIPCTTHLTIQVHAFIIHFCF